MYDFYDWYHNFNFFSKFNFLAVIFEKQFYNERTNFWLIAEKFQKDCTNLNVKLISCALIAISDL